MLQQYTNQSCFCISATVRKRDFKNAIYDTIKSRQMPRNESNKDHYIENYKISSREIKED